VDRLRTAGCEVLICPGGTHRQRLDALLVELGRRRMTNVLVEGGSRLLGAFFDARAVDEVHAFIAPKMFGGEVAPAPIAGAGLYDPNQAFRLDGPRIELVAGDIYIHGHVEKGREQAAS
jgi:diaminohydroxyphosphoribosylaminopyrimidine deaminase/5-amino-6-(5-phosphoribosylamino)uracil reductase